ncbi:MAG: ankyrin repeat domain-containing protein [Thermofilum sp.]|uniref:ankyrin repeat domain-containing protein n=1 Tax=Thermofilum sp. TaxID=1961369 RepID=UPI002582A3D1|nr:ankyrin repeat domain-containing protein [Thermofilum sp.]MCI4409190.1 ankyrin repeat domain-containing protein [Thermofilum sp.]
MSVVKTTVRASHSYGETLYRYLSGELPELPQELRDKTKLTQAIKQLAETRGIEPQRIVEILRANKLIDAVLRGDKRHIEGLLSRGYDPNLQDWDGDTALHYACREGDIELVELLLRHGADPDIENNEGETPLAIAIAEGYNPRLEDKIEPEYRRIAKLLIEYGADPGKCVLGEEEVALETVCKDTEYGCP